MLEIRNLTKIYTAKGGVSVRALDGVSLTFEDTGMVFFSENREAANPPY